MIPEVRWSWYVREWDIDVKRWRSGLYLNTGVWVRGGLMVCFGPLSFFWPEDR
jgi:hypothetical protein